MGQRFSSLAVRLLVGAALCGLLWVLPLLSPGPKCALVGSLPDATGECCRFQTLSAVGNREADLWNPPQDSTAARPAVSLAQQPDQQSPSARLSSAAISAGIYKDSSSQLSHLYTIID